MIARLAVPALLLLFELLLASYFFDTRDLTGKGLLAPYLRATGPWAVRGAVAFGLGLILFAWPTRRALSAAWKQTSAGTPASRHWFGLHILLVIVFAFSATLLFRGSPAARVADVLTLSMAASGLLAVLALARTVLSFASIRVLYRTASGSVWLAGASAALVVAGGTIAQRLWLPSAHVTFRIVNLMLGAVLPEVVSQPEKLIIGSSKFQVTVEPACSGYEGLALTLAFTCVWLWLFRKEYRFPAALALVPLALGAIFLLNSLRIAVLILIGHAGAPDVALGGFHSQAGWISFNLVAIGFCLLSARLPMFRANPVVAEESLNPVAPYLVPFLVIVAAGMLSKAFSSDFEYLYPLRLVAGAAALWHYRRSYRGLGWSTGWAALLGGLGVFVIWVALDRSAPSEPPPQLAALPAVWRWFWLICRVLGTTLTVPLAEELAFRGYLYRRLIAPDFEQVAPRAHSWIALGVSSLAFGALHGSRWVEGVLAGLIYGQTYILRGRLGDAAAAHAITNALLVVLVAATGDWRYW